MGYNEKDILVLTDEEHVRKRVPVYLGTNSLTTYQVPFFNDGTLVIKDVEFVPATYKAVNECFDNAIDEFVQHRPTTPLLQITAQPVLGSYEISDNGRGVPIGKHETGKYTPEVVFGSLRSGRNFGDESEAGVIGMNGMGVSLVQICSTEFNIDIHRDNKRYRQQFTQQGPAKPVIRKAAGNKTGTSVRFTLDDTVFTSTTLPDELMENRAIEIALTNPGVTTTYNGHKYKFKKGFEEIVKTISNNYFKFEQEGMEFFVIFDINEGVDEQIFSWVNSSLLFDGGICNTQFLNAFYDKVIKQTERDAKKLKCVVTKNDVRTRLLVLGNLRISKPEYDAQAKTRLTGPNMRKEMGDITEAGWSLFARRNKQWLADVIDRAMVRHHASANKKAVKDHSKKNVNKIEGLIDASGTDRSVCQLLITEGDSASSMITNARNPKTTGSLPLTGKVNNVYGSTIAQLLSMGKTTDLLTTIGLVPGKKAMRHDLRYNKIIIATDADHDGADIFTLLVNLFFQFWPELFDKGYAPVVYRLVAPNICAIKGKQRIHFPTRAEYESVKSKYQNGWTIEYFKGLGAMETEDWEMILQDERCLIPVVDDGKIGETLSLLFGPSADDRKAWLQDD
jgi:DNA gyrase/topoisomerase IV subunit B